VGLSSDVHSRNDLGPETDNGFFAIPIMVLTGTPAGPPSAPRRLAAHQFRRVAGQQEPKGQGGAGWGWVCEKSLYEDRDLRRPCPRGLRYLGFSNHGQ
jgi:hypothetical protein